PKQRAAIAAAATVLPPVAAVPPGWTEIPIAITPTSVRVVGHTTAARNEDAGIARARDEAIGVLLGHLLEDLRDEPIYPFVKTRAPSRPATDDVQRVARRFEQQLGPELRFQRVDWFARSTAYGLDVWAQYELSPEAYADLVEFYGRHEDTLGLTVGHWFPSIEARMRNDHPVIVLAVDGNPAKKAGIKPADAIATIEGQEVLSVDEFLAQVELVRPGHTFELGVTNNLAPRDVGMTRPRSK
ncbi:MAG: PDZ domain-containing protein, partial [Myxococcota bacterium]